MKLNNKNINTLGKYFIMVLAALVIYKMVMPAVEGWRLKDQNYDCRIMKAKDYPDLAELLGENAKRVKVCKDGKYRIINQMALKARPYKKVYKQDTPSRCRSMCMNDKMCGGFVYDRKLKQCNFQRNITESIMRYYPGRTIFGKM